MKRTLSLLMLLTGLLLMTQCRKPSVQWPTGDEDTVSMTITAGPGRTDISTTGGIVWSSGDRIYVSDGTSCRGYLELQSGAGSPTGVFTGTVSDLSVGEQTLHFFYLGSGNSVTPSTGATTATVSFASQDITADANGKLTNANKYHIGYGTAKATVSGSTVSKLNVTMESKVAIAYLEFKNGDDDYTGALTLSGDHIYNSMTVNFNGESFAGKEKGNISLTNTESAQKYVMLIPTGNSEETVDFTAGKKTGSTKFYKGIEANKFYRMADGSPIQVAVTVPLCLPGEFSVSATKTVHFSRGNLYWDGSKFKMEENQWGFANTWSPSHVSHFYWSKTALVAYAKDYSDNSTTQDDVFFTNKENEPREPNPKFTVEDEKGTWRTLCDMEWKYVLNVDGASSGARTDVNRFAKARVNGVNGLVVFPDGYALPSGYTSSGGTGMSAINTKDAAFPGTEEIPAVTWSGMESDGAVFLPSAGSRKNSTVTLTSYSFGGYWLGQADSMYEEFAHIGYSNVDDVGYSSMERSDAVAVRLARLYD